MPADYQSAAAALAVSPSPPSSPSNRTRPSTEAASWRRLSHRMDRHGSLSSGSRGGWGGGGGGGGPLTFATNMWKSGNQLALQIIRAYLRLPVWQRVAVAIGVVMAWVVLILGIIYSHALFTWLAPISKSWHDQPGGWLLIVLMVFATSIPPMIGYSTASTIAGFVYGFPLGWPFVVVGSTLGSLCAFLLCRTVLSGYVDRMVGKDHRFVALGQVLRREGLLYLTAIRFCPLPFSLSNGFLATIPTISPVSFVLATVLSSPKLLIHVFIGSQLAYLAEKGDDMTTKDKAINWLSMIIGGAVGFTVGLLIYRRTMARAAELAREEGSSSRSAAAAEEGRAIRGDAPFEDDGEGTLMDPEDAAALMSDDDLSLWETHADEYRDESDDVVGPPRRDVKKQSSHDDDDDDDSDSS